MKKSEAQIAPGGRLATPKLVGFRKPNAQLERCEWSAADKLSRAGGCWMLKWLLQVYCKTLKNVHLLRVVSDFARQEDFTKGRNAASNLRL
jgi:hypothetical protein